MGGGGGGGSPAAAEQAQLARRLFAETDPLRRALSARFEDFLGTGEVEGPVAERVRGLSTDPIRRALKSGVESQFGNAREQIIEDTPAGGALVQALAELEAGKARTLSAGEGAIAEEDFGRNLAIQGLERSAFDRELTGALGLATGQTGSAISGLGQAGGIQAALAQAEADREAGIYGALGTGIGTAVGLK